MALVKPIVGDWYEDLDENTTFSVLSADEEAGVVEIQYADGSIEEIDMNSWRQMSLEEIEAPADWEEALEGFDDFDDDGDEVDVVEEEWAEVEDYDEYG
jgi:hypothetical protein